MERMCAVRFRHCHAPVDSTFMHRLLQASRAAAVAIGLLWAARIQAQFVAFNDHAPGTNYTAPFTTTWDCLIAPTGGLLKNINTGLDTPVTLNITRTTIN